MAWCGMMWHDVAWFFVMFYTFVTLQCASWCVMVSWRSMMLRDALWCFTILRDVPWCNLGIMMLHDVSWCLIMLCDASWCFVMSLGITWYHIPHDIHDGLSCFMMLRESCCAIRCVFVISDASWCAINMFHWAFCISFSMCRFATFVDNKILAVSYCITTQPCSPTLQFIVFHASNWWINYFHIVGH